MSPLIPDGSKWVGRGIGDTAREVTVRDSVTPGVVRYRYTDWTGHGDEWFAGRESDSEEEFLASYIRDERRECDE